MKITNQQVFDSIGALQELMGTSLPITLSFKLSKVAKDMDPIIKSIEELRKKSIDKYTEKDDDGNPMTIEDQPGMVKITDPDALSADLEELFGIEVDVNVDTIEFSSFEASDVNIKPATLLALDWLIVG